MNYIEVLLTSVSMSFDACTINATNGLNEKNMKVKKMILISLTFGFFQFLMPLVGYLIGSTFKSYIEKFLPYIAFSLLSILSLKSLIEWIKSSNDDTTVEKKKITVMTVITQGIATSIDALCIGFVYLYLVFSKAIIAFLIIGGVTFILSFTTVYFAKFLAKYLEKYASLIASIVFFALGLKILLEGIL